MTNEEILKMHFLTEANYAGSDHGSWFTVENIESAMEAARKDEGEKVLQWVLKNAYPMYDFDYWHIRKNLSGEAYTTEQLYKIFEAETYGK